MPEQEETRPPQTQPEPGLESAMDPAPRSVNPDQRGSGKLQGKVALVSGGDSGIGRAVAVAFAKEGANVAVLYREEHEDAKETARLVESEGGRCLTCAGDVGDPKVCQQAVSQTLEMFGRLDVLVNNAGEQHPQKKLEDISPEQLERTFRTNVFGYFFLTQAALPHLKEGSAIINTSSVTAYRGSPELLDYSSSKGAEVSFTRSLALALASRKIRVNSVAPGPIWTPLIVSTFEEDKVKTFGADTPLGRPGEPEEVASAYLYLASEDSSYVTGQTLHVNGGTPVAS